MGCQRVRRSHPMSRGSLQTSKTDYRPLNSLSEEVTR